MVLALRCSTIEGLMTGDAFDRLLTFEWLSRPACILNLLFLLIVGIALGFASKIDGKSFNKVPREEREQILMRSSVSTSWDFTQDGSHKPECEEGAARFSFPTREELE